MNSRLSGILVGAGPSDHLGYEERIGMQFALAWNYGSMEEEEYKRRNIRLAITYFLLLVSIQVLGIYLILMTKIRLNPILVIIVGVMIASVLPLVLAVIIFGWGRR